MAEKDFDEFLAESVKREEIRANNERRQAPITAKLQTALDVMDFPRLFDFDPIASERRQKLYFLQLREALEENYADDDILAVLHYEPELFERALDKRCDAAVARQYLFEASLVEMARLLISMEEIGKENQDENVMSRVTNSKKAFMAHLIVSEGMTPDDPWYQFFEKVVPGDSLNQDSDADTKYMMAAVEKVVEDEARDRLFDEFIEETLAAAGIDIVNRIEADKDLGETVITLAGVVSKDYLAKSNFTMTYDKEQIRASWEEILREAARDLGAPIDVVEKLITFFEVALPKYIKETTTDD